jgi:hypothetical protein
LLVVSEIIKRFGHAGALSIERAKIMGETSDSNRIKTNSPLVRGINGIISSRTIYDSSFEPIQLGMTLDKPEKLRTSSEPR